jgi:outer membrane protein TolC
MKRALGIVLLVGCSSAERPWDLPWPREPEGYAAPGEPSAKPVREGRFKIDLPTVLRLAGANSLDLAYVREKVHEAYAMAEMAEEKFWPTAGPILAFRRHEGLTQGTDGAFLDVDKQQTFAGVGARLRWDVGDAVFSTLSASQRYEAQRSFLEGAEQSVQLEAALAYYELMREHLRAGVSARSAEVSEKLATELDASVQAGRGFRGDMLGARVQSASSRLQLLRSREAITLASIRLGAILRLAPGIELEPAESVPGPLDLVPLASADADLLKEALERRPEVRQAESELAAHRHDRTSATWGPLLPEIQLDAVAGGLGPVPSDLESTEDYAVTLGWRLGPGGLLDPARRRLAESRVRQAEIRIERVRQGISEEVLSSLARVRAKAEQVKLADQAVRDAVEALDLTRERQSRQIGLPLEVLRAEEALTRARLDHDTAMIDYSQGQLRAFAAVGRRHGRDR